MYKFVNHIAGQNAFRAVCDENLSFELGAFFEDQGFHFVRRADRGGRFDHVQVAFLQERDYGFGCRLNIGNVGFVIALERSGDNDKVRIADNRSSRCFEHAGFHDFFTKRLQTGFHDVDFALIGHVDDFLVDVDTGDFHSVFCSDDCGWKSDVPKSHETSVHKCDSFMLVFY